MDHGDLTTAMRASLSAPGVFSPVETDGRLLVDGGLSSNLPIDVAREMGVDILIVVDCGFPLLERGKLDSVATVSNQMLAILIRRNTSEQRKTLTDRDVVIDPALGDFSSLDFGEHEKAMQAGRGGGARPAATPAGAVDTSRGIRAARRGAFARPHGPAEGASSCASIPARSATRAPSRRCSATRSGKVADSVRLSRRVAELYGQGNLEILDYRLMQNDPLPGEQPEYGLALTTRRNSWGPNYLRFGLAAAERLRGQLLVQRGRARHAGRDHEIRRRVGVGPADRRNAARRHRGLSAGGLPLALVPGAACRVPDPHAADRGRRGTNPGRIPRAHHDYGLDLGRELGNYGEVRIGGGRTIGEARVRIGDPLLPASRVRQLQFVRRVPLRQRRRREFPAPRQHLAARLAGRARRQRRGCQRRPAAVRPALRPLLGSQHR